MGQHVYKTLLASSLLVLAACSEPRTALERVKASGELRVLTRLGQTTYFMSPEGPAGLEYVLAQDFADQLGVKLRLETAGNVADILDQVSHGEVDFAAAGLSITDARKSLIRFTPPYQEITPQLVYRTGTPRPYSIADIKGHVEVLAGSSHAEQLRALSQEHPDLDWVENDTVDSNELLHLVWERVIDFAVVDSNELQLNRRFYPQLRAAFDLSEPEPLAWAFPKGEDSSLYDEAVRYFEDLRQSGRLAQLLERHYGHLDEFDYVGTEFYQRHILKRLPRFRPAFEEAARKQGVDWRLLAAMGYQESHWDPAAVSPTGVRGLMMLTRNTARSLGIKERTDPTQSIMGGARYLRRLLDSIPEEVVYPDRQWFAIAAYNVGPGALEDARVITEGRGGNPNKWVDVKKSLPLLRQAKWYRKTRNGYARGDEAVLYVERIRSYYDILVWITERDQPAIPLEIKALNISPAVL